LLRAGNHPDFHLVRIEEEAQQIKVDQVRGLIEALGLKSHRGGYKVAVIEGAEALNANGANAFLKTLEEPTADTVLIMIAKPANRLPATIASRCLRVNIQAPPRALAIDWLKANSSAAHDWDSLLALCGGAPLLALQREAVIDTGFETEMQASMQQLAQGAVDVSLLAERWTNSDPLLRLEWLENWITQRVRAQLGCANSRHSAEPVGLPAALLKAKIRALFGLLDASREFRRFAASGMNRQLALEALLLGGRSALSS
jgi:DNA polymerase III subunit delta'